MNNVYEKHVFMCTEGKKCPLKGNVDEMLGYMRMEVKEKGLKDKIRINKAGCFDWCNDGPVMVVYPEGTWYTNVQMEEAKEIFEEHILNNRPVERLIYKPEHKE